MSTPLPDAQATPVPKGLIDTIQAGFDTVNKNLWLLVFPLLLDLALWLGPQLTPGAVVETWLRQGAAPPGSNRETVEFLEQSRRSALEMIQRGDGVARYNVLSMLAVPILGMPSFRAGSPGLGPVHPLASSSALVGATLSSVIAGVALAALFYGLLGQAVRGGRADPRGFAGDYGAILLALWGLLGLLVVVVATAGSLVGVIFLALNAVAPVAAAVAGPLVLGVVIWALVYLFFTTDAVFVSRVPPLAAAQRSISVVRYNFWSTLAFIALITVIGAGLPILWSELARSLQTPGVAIGILGHNYITAGIAAASMTYYKVRFARLEDG